MIAFVEPSLGVVVMWIIAMGALAIFFEYWRPILKWGSLAILVIGVVIYAIWKAHHQ